MSVRVRVCSARMRARLCVQCMLAVPRPKSASSSIPLHTHIKDIRVREDLRWLVREPQQVFQFFSVKAFRYTVQRGPPAFTAVEGRGRGRHAHLWGQVLENGWSLMPLLQLRQGCSLGICCLSSLFLSIGFLRQRHKLVFLQCSQVCNCNVHGCATVVVQCFTVRASAVCLLLTGIALCYCYRWNA